MKNKYLLLSLFLSILCQGCANLEHLNTFSTGAVKTLKSYNDIDYTYTSGYKKYVLTQKDFEFNVGDDLKANKIQLPQKFTVAGEPETAIKADKAINFLFTGLTAYFQGLANISDKDLVNYNYDDVAKNLKADATLKTKLGGITNGQIDASSKIAKVLTDEIMKAYRAKTIKNVIINHDNDVAAVADALIKILSGPRINVLNIDRKLLDTKYQVILLDDHIDLGTKVRLREKYLEEQTELDSYENQINNLVKALGEIKAEHHSVVDLLKTNKIDSQEVKDKIKYYGGVLEDLLENIKNLKK